MLKNLREKARNEIKPILEDMRRDKSLEELASNKRFIELMLTMKMNALSRRQYGIET